MTHDGDEIPNPEVDGGEEEIDIGKQNLGTHASSSESERSQRKVNSQQNRLMLEGHMVGTPA